MRALESPLIQLNLVEGGRVLKTAEADHPDIIRSEGVKFLLGEAIALIADRIPDAVRPTAPPETLGLALADRLNDMHADKGLGLFAVGAAGDGGDFHDEAM